MVLLQNYAPSVNYNRMHLGFVVCVYKSRFFPGIPGLDQTLPESRIFFQNREIPNPNSNASNDLNERLTHHLPRHLLNSKCCLNVFDKSLKIHQDPPAKKLKKK